MTTLLDGKKLSEDLKDEIKVEVDAIISEGKRPPHLSAILVGNNPASESYMRNKVSSCNKVGFSSDLIRQEESISQTALLDLVKQLNEETIDSAVGKLRTVKLLRSRPGSSSETTIWLAKDWNYLIVKLEQREDDEVYSLELLKAKLDGKAVEGLR